MAAETLPLPVFTPADPDDKNVERFRRRVNETRGLHLKDYRDLQAYSVHPKTFQQFWQDVWDFTDIKASKRSDIVITPNDGTWKMFPPPRFFPDARLNFAENVFEKGPANKLALVEAKEGGTDIKTVTYGELWDKTRELASAMRNMGIQKGDRVAAIISNSINAFAIFLATLSIGAIFSSSACDMGAPGINDRLSQIRPKLIFADNAALYNGKIISQIDKLRTIVTTLDSPSLQHLVIIPRITSEPKLLDGLAKSMTFDDFLTKTNNAPLVFEQVEFNHPAVIVYSSGTTGKPKCIVHSQGGYLIQMMKEHTLHGDIRPTDICFQYSSTGWIMFNHQFGGLLIGATVVLYDGSPFAPQEDSMIKFVASQKVTTWGLSPKYLAELQTQNVVPRESADLSTLRVVSSTGSVLTAAHTRWFYQNWPNIPLASISGGTDIMCCFVGAVPSWPLYAGEIQAKSLGMSVEIFSPDGTSGLEATGAPGELVCTMPFPSMPLVLWGDRTGETYRKAYFDKFPGVWHHGDFLAINPVTKGIIMLGRSDGVLNPSGFGSAEIYAVTERFPQILDAICVGQRREDDLDEIVILFLKLKPDHQLSSHLISEIKVAIRMALSARHVPKYVFEVQDIPYTVNGKKVEIAVKQIVSGQIIQVSGTVGNPEALEEYKQFVNVEKVDRERNPQARL